jgi:hypothetical protein
MAALFSKGVLGQPTPFEDSGRATRKELPDFSFPREFRGIYWPRQASSTDNPIWFEQREVLSCDCHQHVSWESSFC